jgi:predicted nucleic acid-binding protein
MSDEPLRQGLLDTNILILRKWINPAQLPDEMAISAITLAELSAGPHEVRRNDEQDMYEEQAERAGRLEILQRAESEFDPVPFDAEAARIYGRVTAAVIAAGRKPRGRAVDLMVAATAIAERLPLYTTNPADYRGLERLMTVVPVTRPPVPHDQGTGNKRPLKSGRRNRARMTSLEDRHWSIRLDVMIRMYWSQAPDDPLLTVSALGSSRHLAGTPGSGRSV